MDHSYDHAPSTPTTMPATRKFSCPLTNMIMEEPVTVPTCDATFERKALLRCMRENGNRCLLSGKHLLPSDLRPDTKLQWEIFFLERRSNDFDDFNRPSTTNMTTTSSQPCKADSPPAHPRSSPHSSPATTKRTKKFDLPPTMPRSPRSSPPMKNSVVSVKGIDYAPMLPRRYEPYIRTAMLSPRIFSTVPFDVDFNFDQSRFSSIWMLIRVYLHRQRPYLSRLCWTKH